MPIAYNLEINIAYKQLIYLYNIDAYLFVQTLSENY